MEDYIFNCLRSCIGEKNLEIELHVVNDGSTDDTLKEIARFRSQYPHINLSLYHTEQHGPAACRNLAAEYVKAPYIAFVDGDDLISSRSLSLIVNRMVATNSDICCPNIIGFKNQNTNHFDFDSPGLRRQILGNRDFYLTNSRDNPEILGLETSMCMRVFKSEFYREAEITFPNLRFCEDVVPSRRALLKAKRVLIDRTDYYYYRINRIGQRTSQMHEKTTEINCVIAQTMDLALGHVLDNRQGAWILNRLLSIAIWSASQLPHTLQREFAKQTTDTLQRAPNAWWKELLTLPSLPNHQGKAARLYTARASRYSRERIIRIDHYRTFDRLKLKLSKV